MTRPIEEYELSALIDGQLEPQRVAEVRSAIEQNVALRAEYEHLLANDRTWTAAARAAQFTPTVRLGTASPSSIWVRVWVAAVLTMALGGRLLPKVLPMDQAVAMLVQGLVLVAIVTAVVWISERTSPQGDARLTASS
jgi:anti-sigma factor RsiW